MTRTLPPGRYREEKSMIEILGWALVAAGTVIGVFTGGWLIGRLFERRDRCPDCGCAPGIMHFPSCAVPQITNYRGPWPGYYEGIK